MAFINQDEQDPRFRALTALASPSAPAPMGTVAPGPASTPNAPQAPQKSSFMNLQDWLGVNKGAGEQLNQGLVNKSNEELGQIGSGIDAASNKYINGAKDYTNHIGANDTAEYQSIYGNVADKNRYVATPYSTEESQDFATREQRARNLANGYRAGYAGPSSLDQSSEFQGLQKRLGTMNQSIGTDSGRQEYLRSQGVQNNRYNSALLSNSSGLGEQVAKAGAMQNRFKDANAQYAQAKQASVDAGKSRAADFDRYAAHMNEVKNKSLGDVGRADYEKKKADLERMIRVMNGGS